MKLDELDIQLLELLQDDSKRTTKEYALKLGLSTTAAYERIKRLERLGVIDKYVVLVNKALVNRSFTAFCHIKLVQHSAEFIRDFEREVKQLKEVVECYHISGDYDYLLKVHLSGMKAYREFLVKKLTVIKHIGSTESSFVIGDVRHSTAVNISLG